MVYFYLLTWLSCLVQGACVTFSIGINKLMYITFNFIFYLKFFLSFFIGAGLFYLAELIEEYANAAKKYINYLILV